MQSAYPYFYQSEIDYRRDRMQEQMTGTKGRPVRRRHRHRRSSAPDS